MKQVLIYFLLLLVTGCHSSTSSLPDDARNRENKTYKVLFIQSSAASQLMPIVRILIEQEFKKADIPVEINYLFHFTQDQSTENAMRVLIEKLKPYNDNPPDLILTVNDDAFNFLLATEYPMVYDVPIVFSNLTFPLWSLLDKHTNITGQLETVDYRQAYELACRLFGEIDEIQLVYGFQRLDSDFYKEESKQIRKFPELSMIRDLAGEGGPESIPVDTIRPPHTLAHPLKVCFDILTVWPFDQFTRYYDREKPKFPIRRIGIKPAEEFIYSPFFSYYYVPFINVNNAYFPSVTFEGYPVYPGCVGGYMNPIENQAKTAVERAVRILKGEPVSHFPIDTAPRIPIFDWNAMQHWNIQESDLPPGSRIVNKPFQLEYRGSLIAGGILLTLLLSLLAYSLIHYSRLTKIAGNSVFRKLQEEQEHMQTTVNSVNEGIISFNQKGLLTSINPVAITLLQTPKQPDELVGEHIHSVLRLSPRQGNDLFWLYELATEARTTGKKQFLPEGTLLHLRNGKTLRIVGVLRPLSLNGENIGTLFTFRDCTDKLRESEFLEFSMAAGDVYTWQLNGKEHTLSFHTSFFDQNQIEHTDSSISSDRFLELIHPDDQAVWIETLGQMQHNSQGDKQNVQIRLALPAKGYTWFEFRISSMPATELNRDTRFYGICLSIQKLKETETSLIQVLNEATESNRLKAEFLANMSHEIRTPLNAIVGFSTIIEEVEPEEREQFMQLISQNCDMLLQTINDILDISRVESGYPFQYKMYSLQSLLSGFYQEKESLFAGTGLQFLLEMPPTDILFETDIFRLKQILEQLLKNAIQFTQKGSVTIGYRINDNKKKIGIYVRDTGIGIAPENRKIVFERFYKLNNFTAGGGLGLSLCMEIVHRMQGTIDISDGVEGGTCINIWLPVRQENKEPYEK